MQKNKSSKIKNIFKKGISFLLIAFIFVGAFSSYVIFDKKELIFNKFFGKKSELQGVLNLWLISSFESGIASKKVYFERAALKFEKQNKGLYILIQEFKEEELKNKLIAGEKPDIVVFSGNYTSYFSDMLIELDKVDNQNPVIFDSARKNNTLFAYPCMIGGYILASTKSRLSNAGVKEDTCLFSNIYNLGYTKKLKKSIKNIYSVSFGAKNGNFPQIAIENQAKQNGIKLDKNELSCVINHDNLTGYQAYLEFCLGNSVMLIGTQRDLDRLVSREKSGREIDFVFEYISAYSDLVDYVGVIDSEDKTRKSLSVEFAKFLVSKSMQSELSRIGLFSVLNLEEPLYSDKYFASIEQNLKNIIQVPRVFS